MRKALVILWILSIISCRTQENEKFNLGFEYESDKSGLSDGWKHWGKYTLSIDNESYTGDKSGKISSDSGGGTFGSIAYKIPADYEGSSLRLDGFIKIENVRNGFAGLFYALMVMRAL